MSSEKPVVQECPARVRWTAEARKEQSERAQAQGLAQQGREAAARRRPSFQHQELEAALAGLLRIA